MATGLRPSKTMGTTLFTYRTEAAAATFAVGDPVSIDGSGQVTPITAATDLIYGVAAEAGTKSAGDTIVIWPARKGMVWEGQAAGTPTQAQIGTIVDFSVFTSGGMQIDTATSTNDNVVFVGKRDFEDAFSANMDILVTIADAHNSWEAQG